jgi:hypothetical protein
MNNQHIDNKSNENDTVKLPIPKNFDLDAPLGILLGPHRACLHKIENFTNKFGEVGVKLTWVVRNPVMGDDFFVSNYYAGRYYSAMLREMKLWLGDEFDDCLDDEGSLVAGKLIQREADILVKEMRTKGHATPYRYAAVFKPCGSLVDDEEDGEDIPKAA